MLFLTYVFFGFYAWFLHRWEWSLPRFTIFTDLRLAIERKRRIGFTLVELSVVLVVIGLIVGSVLVGRDLIRASELRAVATDVERLKTAVNTFRVQYNCLPGDCPNASQFWGFYNTNPIVCSYSPSGTQASCDGDGNSQIDTQNSLGSWQETYTFWKHLSNAGYWSGSFTGASGDHSDPENNIPGVNVPWSRFPNGIFAVQWIGNSTSSTAYFDGSYGNAVTLGATVAGDRPLNSILSANDAHSLDTKFDDGMPGTGSIRALVINPANGNGACTGGASPASPSTATYASSSVISCTMVFPNAF